MESESRCRTAESASDPKVLHALLVRLQNLAQLEAVLEQCLTWCAQSVDLPNLAMPLAAAAPMPKDAKDKVSKL